MTKTHILNLKDCCALTMDYWKDTDNPDSDMNRLVYGTDSGNVCVFDFPDRLIVDRGTRKKDSHLEINMDYINNKPVKYFGSLIKRKSHNDWVLKVRYYHNMKSVVSCSSDPNQSISIATENNSGKWKVMTAPVPKGVHCFAYCKLPVALVTAGYGASLFRFPTDILIRIE
jgi:hypothetical protein